MDSRPTSESLEAALRAQLVARTPEGVALNELGLLVAGVAESFDTGIEDLTREIGGADRRPEATVRLVTTESIATFPVAGLVPLRVEHPKMEVQLLVGSAALDLMRRGASGRGLFREKCLAS